MQPPGKCSQRARLSAPYLSADRGPIAPSRHYLVIEILSKYLGNNLSAISRRALPTRDATPEQRGAFVFFIDSRGSIIARNCVASGILALGCPLFFSFRTSSRFFFSLVRRCRNYGGA